MTTGLFTPSLVDPVVSVVSDELRQNYTISWPAQTAAFGYRVYAGFDPVHVRVLISGIDPLPVGQVTFNYQAPVYPPAQIMYFWVAWTDAAGNPTFLDDYGSYLLRTNQLEKFNSTARFSETSLEIIAPDDSQYYMEEIRRRAKAIMEDTCEEVDLFIKQWNGLPDPTTQAELGLDPNYQAMTRADNTYGVGFYPGYFPATRMLMRFGGLPQAMLDFQIPGLRPLLQNEAWTCWDPILHENDLLVRVQTGQRYVTSSVSFGNWRSVPISQRLTLQVVNQTSPLQKVTNSDLISKWQNLNAIDYARTSFSITGGSSGEPNMVVV